MRLGHCTFKINVEDILLDIILNRSTFNIRRSLVNMIKGELDTLCLHNI